MTFTMFLAFWWRPCSRWWASARRLTEALAGLDRTQEVLHERPEDEDPRRTVPSGHPGRRESFENVNFSYDPGKPVLHDVSFESRRAR
jgi:ABC-type bacteriocin/lantibiotic exporter with double-glycine peptidase domain